MCIIITFFSSSFGSYIEREKGWGAGKEKKREARNRKDRKRGRKYGERMRAYYGLKHLSMHLRMQQSPCIVMH